MFLDRNSLAGYLSSSVLAEIFIYCSDTRDQVQDKGISAFVERRVFYYYYHITIG